ncbi:MULTISPECIES: SDR family oxidoreductase [Nocardia]|uniref:SDR family oxidoreductase n=1 Tax=Nocardia abscessus TaxID=120957 RepID=UPI001892FDD8|nr:SDR family oxidoreductase [Nocardia abscessus]
MFGKSRSRRGHEGDRSSPVDFGKSAGQFVFQVGAELLVHRRALFGRGGPTRSRRLRGTGSTPQIVQSTPLGRVGEPDDIAGVVEFPTSDAARWITGASVPAGGGAF